MTGGLILRKLRGAAILIAVLGMLFPVAADAATLNELLQQQAELKRREEANKAALEQKKREANTLAGAIEGLDDDIAYTNSRINNTEDQIDTTNQVIAALNTDITTNENELRALTTKLNNAYVSLYELSQTSTMELLLQSDSLDEVVSQAQYIQAIQTDLQGNIAKTNTIRADLDAKKAEADKQKADLEGLKSQLSASRAGLSAQRSQKDALLERTQGEQARYEELLAQIRREASNISNEIYQARLAAGGFVGGGGTGGYPWAGNCDKVDPWLFYTCQCTSYAAWKFLQIHGVPFDNTRPGSGSAYNWPALAADQGYTVQSGGTPQVGDAVSWNRPLFAGDQWGHVAIVEAVFSSTDVLVSEYNWSPAKKFSQRRINPFNHGTPRYIRP